MLRRAIATCGQRRPGKQKAAENRGFAG